MPSYVESVPRVHLLAKDAWKKVRGVKTAVSQGMCNDRICKESKDKMSMYEIQDQPHTGK